MINKHFELFYDLVTMSILTSRQHSDKLSVSINGKIVNVRIKGLVFNDVLNAVEDDDIFDIFASKVNRLLDTLEIDELKSLVFIRKDSSSEGSFLICRFSFFRFFMFLLAFLRTI